MSDFVQQQNTICDFSTSDSWVILSPIEQSIKKKIEAVGTPLKDWDINIYRGVLTGYNEAFIINTEKRDEILANCQTEEERKRTAELIRPILRGRDIKRYGYDWNNLWLIYIPWHFPYQFDESIQGASEKAEKAFKEQYPAVYSHMLQYKDPLSKRNKAETGIRYEWYAMQRWGAKYWEDFFKPKIVWGEISDRSKFAYEANGKFIPEATTFLLTGTMLPYLFCVLNSPLSEWFFSKVGTTTGVGTVRWKKYTILELLLPAISPEQYTIFENYVSSFLEGNYTSNIFSEKINSEIYKIVGLSKDEISYITHYYPQMT